MTHNVHRLPGERRGRLVGVRAARRLREAEHSLDRALADKLALGQMLLSARVEARMGVAVGQSVMADLARAFSLAVEARGALGAAHDGLARLAADHGILWSFDGPVETKPGERPFLSRATAS